MFFVSSDLFFEEFVFSSFFEIDSNCFLYRRVGVENNLVVCGEGSSGKLGGIDELFYIELVFDLEKRIRKKGN